MLNKKEKEMIELELLLMRDDLVELRIETIREIGKLNSYVCDKDVVSRCADLDRYCTSLEYLEGKIGILNKLVDTL